MPVGSISIWETYRDDLVEKQEQEYQWRCVMSRIWRCLSTNVAVRSLAICALPPGPTSTWFTEDWKAFLGRLETISIDIWGGDNGVGWNSNTCPGYLHFLNHLDKYFFNHAKSSRKLSIKADEGSPYGGVNEYFRHASLALGQMSQLPKLEELCLENCIVDFNLMKFIESHAEVLRELRLIDCMSCHQPDQPSVDWGPSWAEFFSSVLKCSLSISDIVISNKSIPLTTDEAFRPEHRDNETGQYRPPADEPADARQIREQLKRDDKLRLFPYICLDDKYGMVFAQEEANMARFQSGEDQLAYDHLMEVVKRRASVEASTS